MIIGPELVFHRRGTTSPAPGSLDGNGTRLFEHVFDYAMITNITESPQGKVATFVVLDYHDGLFRQRHQLEGCFAPRDTLARGRILVG